jgi:dTMP kinase
MFITLEGMEGAGKSTLAQGLVKELQSRGFAARLTREPGGSELGKTLRALLLGTGGRITPRAELFMFLADRAQHVAEVIRPALAAGEIVICDRYIDSTLVYQGQGRKLDTTETFLRELNNLAVDGLWPDLTFVLDVDAAIGLGRSRGRLGAQGKADAEGRFEAEPDSFHQTVRQGFLHAAAMEPNRITLLDAGLSAQSVLSIALIRITNHPAFKPARV